MPEKFARTHAHQSSCKSLTKLYTNFVSELRTALQWCEVHWHAAKKWVSHAWGGCFKSRIKPYTVRTFESPQPSRLTSAMLLCDEGFYKGCKRSSAFPHRADQPKQKII